MLYQSLCVVRVCFLESKTEEVCFCIDLEPVDHTASSVRCAVCFVERKSEEVCFYRSFTLCRTVDSLRRESVFSNRNQMSVCLLMRSSHSAVRLALFRQNICKYIFFSWVAFVIHAEEKQSRFQTYFASVLDDKRRKARSSANKIKRFSTFRRFRVCASVSGFTAGKDPLLLF